MQARAGIGRVVRPRVDVPAVLLAKSEFHRVTLEVREETGTVLQYYADFALFKTAITDCLTPTSTTCKQDLDLLLTLNFQTFSKPQLLVV